MKRLAVRLVVSHALVAVIATLACVVVVHRLAPAIFDESLRMGFGRGMPPGFGPGVLRGQVAEAVDRAMLVGTVLGVLAATAFGAVAATALTRPLARLRLATRQLAEGRYDVPVTAPATRELADLADDITTLASALADTEARRVRLLGDVAHELRTPLTVVDGYVEGMIDGVIPTTAEELARVGAEVARLRRLADDLYRIFERFYRVDPRRPGGSGIGLTIARGLVEAHHGSLVARSAGPGRGAVFTARLPAAGQDARPGGGGET
jgi:histidine kinase